MACAGAVAQRAPLMAPQTTNADTRIIRT
jgi:hypothetical protein